jgi:hypothetical protein
MARKKNHQKKELHNDAIYTKEINLPQLKVNKLRNKADFFEVTLGSRSNYFFVALLAAMLFMVFGSFIFGDRLFLFRDIGSDTINGFYPKLYYIAQYLREAGFPKWSFSEGMGQNILPASLGDPFNWLLYIIGKDYLAYGIAWVEFIKIFCAGIFFYAFLRILRISYHTSFISALAYSFSGFMMVGSGWYIFSTQGVYAALLLLCFEHLFQRRRWWPFALTVFLIALNSPFDLYLFGVLIIIYSTVRMYDEYGAEIKKYFPVYLLMLILGIVGVLMSSVMLVSSIDQMLNSPRVLGDASFFKTLSSSSVFAIAEQKHNFTALARLFANDLAGGAQYHAVETAQGTINQYDFTGWYNYLEAPALYSGIFTLLLIPQAILLSNNKKRNIYVAGLLMAVIPVLFPYLRYTFWLFSGDYYRTFCLFFSVILLLIASQALDLIYTKGKVHIPILVLTLFFWLGMLYLPFSDMSETESITINDELRNLLVLIIIGHSLLIAGLGIPNLRSVSRIVLLCLAVVEMVLVSSYTFNADRSVITKNNHHEKIFYNDYTRDAVEKIKQKDTGFFRISKYYSSGAAMHTSINDAKVQGYFGTSSYHSFNQKNYIRFLGDMGIINNKNETETRWAKGLQDHPLVQVIASNKYMLVKKEVPNFPGYQIIDSAGDARIFKNQYFLPLGFTYDHYLDSSTFHRLVKDPANLRKQIALLKCLIVDDKDLSDFKTLAKFDTAYINPNYSYDEFGADVLARKSDTLNMLKFSHNHITGTIRLLKPKALFFSIPYDPSWNLKVNGKETNLLAGNLGMMAVPLSAGNYNIELQFNPPYWILTWILSGIGFLLFIGLIIINHNIRKKNLSAPNGI